MIGTTISLGILILLAIFHNSISKFFTKIYREGIEYENSKTLHAIEYPRQLKSRKEIKRYLEKNRKQFPPEKQWDSLLEDLINEMSIAGWNTEMPIYTYENLGDYTIKVVATDAKLQQILNEIIVRFLEKYK